MSIFWHNSPFSILGTCQKLAEGKGRGNRGRVTTFWDSEKGGVMKNGPLKGEGHANTSPWSCRDSPTEEKGSSFFGKKNLGEIGESSDQLSESELDS